MHKNMLQLELIHKYAFFGGKSIHNHNIKTALDMHASQRPQQKQQAAAHRDASGSSKKQGDGTASTSCSEAEQRQRQAAVGHRIVEGRWKTEVALTHPIFC